MSVEMSLVCSFNKGTCDVSGLSSPKKGRNEVEWDKCIICQVSTPDLLIKMRNVSKNSLIEAVNYKLVFTKIQKYKNIKNSVI
jgi:hypothetical protein